ncbi:MAG: beta-lactamase family protein [Proteobacteria bacterium]|nr:beta-lactamase family protein [Pseudomonadota bacterium]MBU4298200.1 beta-lactamase family protein [Pseudomonadota bacterium]MCG2748117.1 beta-lactamase family protein [Desulfobulbaceae bacterium]
MDDGSFATGLYENLDPLINDAIMGKLFPGAAVGVSINCGPQKKSFSAVWGHSSLFPRQKILRKENLFDLASLTKPFATTLALICLVQEKKIELDEPLPSLLQRNVPPDKKNITLRHLLNHCSGLADHHPFYQQLVAVDEQERKNTLLNLILADELIWPVGSKALYSDLGFILLGMIVEIQSGLPLDIFVREKVMTPLGLADTMVFNPRQKDKKDFAATENCPWRGKVLTGEVHDDNTYAVGGVSGQAGLFGAIDSVLFLASFLLEVWQDQAAHPHFSGELLKEFFKRQDMVKGSTWALGFDTPSPIGSSAGSFISKDSVGHLGFTGTSFWIDPQRQLVMVLLTNRVHPSRENNLIRLFRPVFHDRVIESL